MNVKDERFSRLIPVFGEEGIEKLNKSHVAVFGIGGVAVVYLIAPLLDNMLKKLNFKAVATVCILLVTVFIGDSVYSRKHPNAGKGITDYPAVVSQTDIKKTT